jgi:electron transport complex protein RnfD
MKGGITRLMWDVVIALVPAAVASIYFFGLRALYIILVVILSSVLTELLIQSLTKRPITIFDGSAAVTGILLAFNLPPGVPLWMAGVGGAIAISIGKEVFGGLGRNIFNPALVARAILLISFPVIMTTWSPPRFVSFDALTYATPLAVLRESNVVTSLKDLFIGNVGGCIGETSALALLVGAAYLFFRKHITWHIPFSFIVSCGVLGWIFGGDGLFQGPVLFHILAGGLLLGALFMATDPVTSPTSRLGRVIFGTGCGAITALIRLKGGPPEGISFSILLMNAFTPLIDRFIRPKKKVRENEGIN